MVRSKNASPTWSDVRTALLDFDRAGLRGLVQDLYTPSKDNQAFLHARLGLGHDQLQPCKASISRWISPDLMKGQPISVSKAKKAIADYKKGHWAPAWDGGAINILLRGGVRLSRILQHGRRRLFCCFDPHVRTVPRNRIEPTSGRAASPTSSVSTSLDLAVGTSAGRSRKNSIAFGTLPLRTSSRANDGSFCRSRN